MSDTLSVTPSDEKGDFYGNSHERYNFRHPG